MAVPFSPETIGRHERGDVEMAPDDIVVYAECYKAPDVMHRYCADCPVGQRLGRRANDRPLASATLRIRYLIAEGMDVANRLEAIAFDDQIDAAEKQDFNEALAFLRRLDESINDIILIGLGNEKAAPGATGSGQRAE